ncbi:MAG: response regulator transcription factor [Eubacteriales bacterium]|nr:response regulator transcription factor [Eubacteriales bacterium]
MIYYVEDDDNIRELVVYTLTQVGLPAQGFSESQSFFAAMEKELPDLVLLDIMLPGEDGLSILRKLRAGRQTEGIPVVMITAKDAEYDKVQGLDLGADDYIAKPFGMAELVARVRARLRRVSPREENDQRFVAGDLVLDDRAHSVTVHGEPVSLTLKEYELLHYLMENSGAAFSREQLLNRIWDYSYEGGSRTVDVHIQTLRAKLGSCGNMIHTVRGIGYRFGGK